MLMMIGPNMCVLSSNIKEAEKEKKHANGKSNRETKRTNNDDVNGESNTKKKNVMLDGCEDAQKKHLPRNQ